MYLSHKQRRQFIVILVIPRWEWKPASKTGLANDATRLNAQTQALFACIIWSRGRFHGSDVNLIANKERDAYHAQNEKASGKLHCFFALFMKNS